MKFLSYGKDGGPESTVAGFWLVEIKSLFSIVLLKFEGKSRDAYHEHAFDAVSWVLKGKLVEETLDGYLCRYLPSFRPVITPREEFHQVHSVGTTWVLSFRGPWRSSWREYLPDTNEYVTLTNGREVVNG